jgi:hypothetical protein
VKGKKMNYAKREKLETYDNSLQIITANCIEGNIEEKPTDFNLEISLEKRKKEVNKPIYIKRI